MIFYKTFDKVLSYIVEIIIPSQSRSLRFRIKTHLKELIQYKFVDEKMIFFIVERLWMIVIVIDVD